MKNNLVKRLLAMALCLCMLLSLYVPSVSAETVSYHDMSMSQLLNLDEDLTWVFTGDSITHNGGWTGGYNDYAAWFEKYLYDIGRGDDTLINTAWGGAAIDHFLPTRSNNDGMGLANFVTKYNPDVVFIKLGMNNRTMADATFVSKYNQMLDGIYAEGAKNGKVPKIVLLSPTPLSGESGISSGEFGSDPTSENYVDSVKRFSVSLSGIATERGLEFVDLRQAMVDESAVLGDRYHYTFFSDPSDGLIHPNGAGQYFMFKTICKDLGLYNASMPIFQVSYDDIVNAPLYSDSTNISYTGEYGADHSVNTNAAEMDKTMPVLEQEKVESNGSKLLAYIDFDSTNGTFVGGNNYAGATRVDLTDAEVMDDALTLAEVQSLEQEFTLVLRARLDPSNRDNQPVLWLSNTNNTWDNSLALGVQGKGDQIYYNVRTSATQLNVNGGTVAIDSAKTVVDGNWHTIAYVQTATGLEYYVDGVLKNTLERYVKSGATIGEVFANTTDLTAHIGSYGTHAGTYHLDGFLDYYQLYKGALSADEIANLNTNSGVGAVVDHAAEMDKTMPAAISDATPLASVDFDSTTGIFAGTNAYATSTRWDLTDAEKMDDALTLEEVQAMGREFTIVFRGRLDSTTNRNHQPILLMNPGAESDWYNSIAVGAPGAHNGTDGVTGHRLYYEVRQGNSSSCKEQTTSPNGITLATTTPHVTNEWHTIAFVQRTDGLDYYIDGVLAQTWDYKFNDGVTVGGLFADATELTAHVGSYAVNGSGTFNLKAKLDYYQFYGTALTNDQVASLVSGAEVTYVDQVNCTMPALPVEEVEEIPALLASMDFSSENGHFAGTNAYATSTRWDLTDASKMTDALTLEEFQALDREFSIVLRAKLDSTTNKNHQPLLMVSPNGVAQWDDAISIGGPGTDNAFYYEVRKGNAENIAAANTTFLNNLSTPTPEVTDEWHTIAIVQRTDGLDYYVDGVLAQSLSHKLKDGVTFGGLFADATDFAAHIGSFAENDATTYNLKADLDFYQIYGGALTADMVQALSPAVGDTTTVEAAEWTDTVAANNVWAVVGADQLSGYLGETPNFSLFRLLNNGMRGGANETGSYRDIRMMNLAKPGQTVAQYDAALSEHQYDVLMLLPEVPEVHAAGYTHSADQVAAYKASILALIEKNAGKAIVLWTPLASNDATVNGYINEYAVAVREIANNDPSVLFFDANKFMNERMSTVGTNWFDDSMNITPLCATDLVYAFYVHANYPTYVNSEGKTKDPTNKGEILSHNLRQSSDKRLYKSGVIKENLSYGVSVSGGNLTVDGSNLAGYTNLRVAVIPALGVGSVVEPWILGNVGESLAAPHSDPCITVYGEKDGVTYRFKDVQLSLSTSSNLTEPYFETDDLTALEVVGAPAIGFDPSKTTYDVELYQYQRQVRIVAEGGSNLTIQVNGQNVKAGEFSQYIAVEDTATVTVTVTGGAADKTYTLNLTKPDYADIIITEVMTDGYSNYTKSGADNYELIEIYNASGEDLNLLDYSIGYIREYPYANDIVEDGEIPYYFTGNDHNFFGNSFLGINQITKYSSYWADKVDQEPEEVIFPADSTMVIWVKFSKDSGTEYGSTLTYDTLIAALEAHSGTHTLTVDVEENGETVTKTIVPTQDQLVVAEIPYGAAQSNVTQNITTTADNFYMDGFQVQQNYNNRRGWLFVLDDSAVRDYYGALTEAGDDIISAAKYVRPGATNKLSSVMYYDAQRGLSVVKNPGYWDTNYSTGHTSDQQGYANMTSFGAIEYWQKPYDLDDTTPAVIANNTPASAVKGGNVAIQLAITDDQDIRYLELYVDADNDGTYETVVKKDVTLITSASNAGKAADVKSYAQTYSLADLQNVVNYYGFVLDGNNNKTELGSAEAPVTISLSAECEHSYEGVETKAPTCLEPGEMTYTCSVCGNSYTEEIAPTGAHNVEHVEESCYNVEHWYCDICGTFWADEALTQITNSKNVIKAEASHNVIHVEESCYNVEHWYCDICQTYWADAELTQITNSKNVIKAEATHTLEHVAAKAATCDEPGNIEYWYCSVCEIFWADEALTQITNANSVILPITHSVEHVEAKAATCEEPGNIEYWYCTECGAAWTDELLREVTNLKNVILPITHNVEHVAAVEPGCENEGNIEYWYCTECGAAWTDELLREVTNLKNVILPITHSVEHVEAKAATCEAEGNVEYWYCTKCQMAWTNEGQTELTNLKNVIVPKADHNFVDGTCSVCGEADPNYIVKFDFSGSTMTLGNELVLNFVYNKALLTGTDNYAKVTIAREDGDYTYEIPQSEWTAFNASLNQIPVKVFAKEMTDEVTVVICNAAGQEVSNPRTGSVVAYCNNLFEKSNVQEDKAMAVDMLNYGAAAQIQFNYREETLANAGLTDELKALATVVTDMEDASVKGPGCAGNTLTLEDKILLNFVYQNATIDKAAYATVSYVDHYDQAVSYNIEAADFLTFNSSMKMVQINTLVVADCRTMVSVELFDAEGNSLGVSKNSVESYTARSGQELFKAILAFGDSAYAKFH